MSFALVGVSGIIKCEMGLAPTPFIVLPDRTITAEFMLIGNITDFIPMANIEPFDECISLANPAVLAATIASGGILTPQPCIPVTPAPWITGALDVLVEGSPVLDQTATLMCVWAGPINVVEPGNLTIMVP